MTLGVMCDSDSDRVIKSVMGVGELVVLLAGRKMMQVEE